MNNPDYLNLNGHLLRIFLAVYDTNSVSRAAEEFDLNQSTVSYSLDKLREYLGDPLFVKAGRGITPTNRAIMLAPHIRAQLAGLEGLVSSEKYQPQLDTNRLTIAANITEMLPQCERLFRSIRTIAPDMPIRLLELGSRQHITKLLESGTADLVLAAQMQQYPASLNAAPFFSRGLVCYFDPAMRDAVSSFDEYCAASHAVIDHGGSTMSYVDRFLEDRSLSRRKLLYAPNVKVLSTLVEGTDLLVTMHDGFKQNFFSHLGCCDLPFEIPNLVVDMIWHRRAEHSGRHTWLRNIAMTVMSEGIGP